MAVFVTFCSNPPYSSPQIRPETPTTRPVLINVPREPDGTVSLASLSISPPLPPTQLLFAPGRISLEMPSTSLTSWKFNTRPSGTSSNLNLFPAPPADPVPRFQNESWRDFAPGVALTVPIPLPAVAVT